MIVRASTVEAGSPLLHRVTKECVYACAAEPVTEEGLGRTPSSTPGASGPCNGEPNAFIPARDGLACLSSMLLRSSARGPAQSFCSIKFFDCRPSCLYGKLEFMQLSEFSGEPRLQLRVWDESCLEAVALKSAAQLTSSQHAHISAQMSH